MLLACLCACALVILQGQKEADKGSAPAGSVECHGTSIERLASDLKSGKGTSWDVHFALHTPERVLHLKANGEDSFRLWVAAIVAAGGRAPLQNSASGAHPPLDRALLLELRPPANRLFSPVFFLPPDHPRRDHAASVRPPADPSTRLAA
jgi:hypothetical protein